MRSSKSRSRSKSNRNRSVGNIVNRVFDSSGPEGKVRGTPQQIIDKYNQLARDAQLGNDRVAFENFQQHAEHYTRMLGEAQREQEARREQQERERQQQQQRRDEQQRDGQPREDQPRDEQPREEQPNGGASGGFEVVAEEGAAGSGLVETPENASDRPRRSRRSRSTGTAAASQEDSPQPDAPEAAE